MADASTSVQDRARARVGSLLRGKWQIDALLGVGGMAAVYAATHRNGSRAAIKMLHLGLSLDDEVKQRFLREGYIANKVDHPGAVAVLDDDVSEDGAAYLVMELLEGESLEGLAQRRGGKLPWAEVLALAAKLLDVLGAAHQNGIVHRDIKPENVFVTRREEVKLLDFGIARIATAGSARLTADGSAFGTPAFMAPEQALGRIREIDARTDLWSVGAMMWTLITGRQVHLADTVAALLVAHATQAAAPIASVAAGLPKRVAAVVDRALRVERDDRWPDARTMAAEIIAALEAEGSAFAPTVPVPAFDPEPASFEQRSSGEAHGAHVIVAPSVRAVARGGGSRAGLIAGVLGGALAVGGAAFLWSARSAPTAATAAAVSSAISAEGPPSANASAPPPANAPSPANASPSAAPAVEPAPSVTASASAAPSARPPAPPRRGGRPSRPHKPTNDSWLDRQH